MLTLIVVTCVSLYLIGLRADRIHAGRAVTKPGTPQQNRGNTVPGAVTVRLYHGRSAAFWNGKFVRMRHLAYARRGQTRKLQRVLLASPSVTEAINLAGATYGHTDTLWRKARCESHLDPNATNGSEASGLLQFLPSTWATTPYARFSIFSPYANALAAGWMHSVGRGGEWSCR